MTKREVGVLRLASDILKDEVKSRKEDFIVDERADLFIDRSFDRNEVCLEHMKKAIDFLASSIYYMTLKVK